MNLGDCFTFPPPLVFVPELCLVRREVNLLFVRRTGWLATGFPPPCARKGRASLPTACEAFLTEFLRYGIRSAVNVSIKLLYPGACDVVYVMSEFILPLIFVAELDL